jgi:hypothetical protein
MANYSHCPECLDISAHLLIAKLFGGKNDSGTCDELERVLLNHVSLQDNRQSLDENCHVLKTLLLSPRSSQSLATISSLFGSICNSWWMGTYVTTIVSCKSRLRLELCPNSPVVTIRLLRTVAFHLVFLSDFG